MVSNLTEVASWTMAGLEFNLGQSSFKAYAFSTVPQGLPMNGSVGNYLKRIINS